MEVFRISTFLDPILGPSCFDSLDRNHVVDSIKALLSKNLPQSKTLNKDKDNNKISFCDRFKRFSIEEINDEDNFNELTDYMRYVSSNKIDNT